MDPAALIFVLVVAAAAIAAIALRKIKRRDSRSEDPGDVLVQFGSNFPDAAVRDVVRTRDGRTSFLRLADGRTGVVEAIGRRYEMRILQPLTRHVAEAGDERTLTIDFGGPKGSRLYAFSRPEDAAELSLWLCTAMTVAGRE